MTPARSTANPAGASTKSGAALTRLRLFAFEDLLHAHATLRCGDKTLDLSRPVVMGVVNVTPDSFSDGGRFLPLEAAVAHGVRLAEEGAAIIDIGGESTRPGAAPVSVEEELRRVVPVVERLRAATQAVISVDTSKPEVIRAAVAAGAGLINDVRALAEPGALEAAAASGCAVCLMHMQGDPRTMQRAPSYVDVVKEVKAFLDEHVQRCRAAGVSSDRIVGRSRVRIRQDAGAQSRAAQAAARAARRVAGVGGFVAQVDGGHTDRP